MIPLKTVENIAKLGRLQLSPTELQKYTQQLNQILGYVEKLNQLDTSSIEATSHAVEIATPLREDVVVINQVVDEVFKISPDSEEHFFRVPKVI